MVFHWNKTPPPNQDPATCTCAIRAQYGQPLRLLNLLKKAKAGTVVSILASGNPSIFIALNPVAIIMPFFGQMHQELNYLIASERSWM